MVSAMCDRRLVDGPFGGRLWKVHALMTSSVAQSIFERAGAHSVRCSSRPRSDFSKSMAKQNAATARGKTDAATRTSGVRPDTPMRRPRHVAQPVTHARVSRAVAKGWSAR